MAVRASGIPIAFASWTPASGIEVSLFSNAGVLSPAIAKQPGRGRFPSVRSMVEADLRGWLPVMGVVLPEDVIARVLEAEEALRAYASPERTVRFDLSAWIVSGTRPQDRAGGRSG